MRKVTLLLLFMYHNDNQRVLVVTAFQRGCVSVGNPELPIRTTWIGKYELSGPIPFHRISPLAEYVAQKW